jgi:hypothetical protein
VNRRLKSRRHFVRTCDCSSSIEKGDDSGTVEIGGKPASLMSKIAVGEGAIPELLSSVPAKATNPGLVVALAAKFTWGLRQYAGRIGCLLPEERGWRVVDQPATGLARARYLEILHKGQALVGVPLSSVGERLLATS